MPLAPSSFPRHIAAGALVVLGLMPTVAIARTQVRPKPVEDVVSPTMVVARLTNALDLDLVPVDLVDRLVRWRLGLRDLFHGASERLAVLAERAGFRAPDLTILTTSPLGPAETTYPTSGFGWREDPIRHRRKFHSGADVRARSGTPVYAAGDGVVLFAGRQSGYGNLIQVDHGGGVITRYAHLRRILVKKNTAITAGMNIGLVGSTGRTTGPHLHFEVRLDGRPVDPGTAMTVGELQRESPTAGQLAAFSLTPEMQALEESDLDPPRTKRAPKGTRPERTGRTKRIRPTS